MRKEKDKTQLRFILFTAATAVIMTQSVIAEGKTLPHSPVRSPSSINTSEVECTYSREYITSLEYLRSHKNFEIPENDARILSEKIANGCTGAAQRFIKVASVISQSGMTAKIAVQTGLEFTQKTDKETENFVSIFFKAFLAEYLDLDVQSALQLAHSLSIEFQGDSLAARDDFERLVEFCVSGKELDLPKPQCAAFAVRIANQGVKLNGGVAKPFITIFTFLTSPSGPNLTTQQALRLGEDLVAGGKDSADNFIQAYKYGVYPQGLSLSQAEAITFAQRMTLPR